jgi:predicted GIY-YIG superfamily endonuclease
MRAQKNRKTRTTRPTKFLRKSAKRRLPSIDAIGPLPSGTPPSPLSLCVDSIASPLLSSFSDVDYEACFIRKSIHALPHSEFCYLLFSDTGEGQPNTLTYIGFTVKPSRRLRQHNHEIKGGARSTCRSRYRWNVCVLVGGFPSRSAALSFEKCWQKCRGHRNRGPLNKFLALEESLKRKDAEHQYWVAIQPEWMSFAHPFVANNHRQCFVLCQ